MFFQLLYTILRGTKAAALLTWLRWRELFLTFRQPRDVGPRPLNLTTIRSLTGGERITSRGRIVVQNPIVVQDPSDELHWLVNGRWPPQTHDNAVSCTRPSQT